MEMSTFIKEYEKKQERDIKIVCLFAYGFLVAVFTYLITKVYL